MFGRSIFFFIKAVLFGISTIVVIPKHLYKKFLIYGFIFGALGDLLMVAITSKLNLLRYMNMGYFNVLGLMSFWTPIAWMFAMMLFLYFLPVRKLFLYPYIVGYGIFGYALGLVLQNLSLFEYIGIYRYFAPLVITSWLAISAYVYLRNEQIEVK